MITQSNLINTLVLLLAHFTTSGNNTQKLTSTTCLSSDDTNYICYVEFTHIDFSMTSDRKIIGSLINKPSRLEENKVNITINSFIVKYKDNYRFGNSEKVCSITAINKDKYIVLSKFDSSESVINHQFERKNVTYRENNIGKYNQYANKIYYEMDLFLGDKIKLQGEAVNSMPLLLRRINVKIPYGEEKIEPKIIVDRQYGFIRVTMEDHTDLQKCKPKFQYGGEGKGLECRSDVYNSTLDEDLDAWKWLFIGSTVDISALNVSFLNKEDLGLKKELLSLLKEY